MFFLKLTYEQNGSDPTVNGKMILAMMAKKQNPREAEENVDARHYCVKLVGKY